MAENQLIDIFLIERRNEFPSYNLDFMAKSMDKMSDKKLQLVTNYSYTKPTMIFIISFLFGYWGIDRFIIGDITIGILKLITLGGFGIWYIIDLFIIINRTQYNNYRDFEKLSSEIIL